MKLSRPFDCISNHAAFFAAALIFVTSIPAGLAQTNVFSRGDSGTNLWENNTNVPWFYQVDSVNRGRPDANVSSTTRHNVFIGHNNNTTMDVNGTIFYSLRTLTLDSGASVSRIFNSNSSSGISLTDGLYINSSSGSHTFNNQFGVDASTVNFSNNGGIANFTNNIFLNANTAAFTGSSIINVSGVLGGGNPTGGGISKSGIGTLLLSGANTYTGTTAVSGGILSIDNNNTTTARLANTSGITINSGGTVLLAQTGAASTNRINDSASISLSGGTLNLNGFSEGSSLTSGVGALTLTANSTIDFGASTNENNVIRFSGLVTQTNGTILSITDWNGIAGTGGGQERLLFTGIDITAFTSLYSQNEVRFNNLTLGYNAIQFDGFYEITAVPEPSTWAGAVLLTGIAGWTHRRRLQKQAAAV